MVWKLTACQIHSQVHLEPAQTFLAQTQVVLKVEVLQTTYAPTQHKKTARGLLKMLTGKNTRTSTSIEVNIDIYIYKYTSIKN